MITFLPYFAGFITLLVSFGFGYAITRPLQENSKYPNKRDPSSEGEG